MSERVPVTFTPAGVTVWVERGATVLEAARRAGVVLPAPCGGRGVCGSCGFRVLSGEPAKPDPMELRGLAVAPPGVRLACRARVEGPLEVRPVVNQGVTPTPTQGEPVADESLVAAVDLGTTTVSAIIIGSASGRELGRATTLNVQQSWGSDVLARLSSALEGSADELRMAAERSAVEALSAACTHAGACLGGIGRLVVAGNSVMMALLAGAKVDSLAVAPFTMPEIGGIVPGGPLSTALPDGCEFVLVPGIASFVGGDVSAGLLAAGLLDVEDTALYLDIGTNAEIAVVTPLGLTVTSAAAGPAFEGFGISSGGPWGVGALERVSVENGDVTLEVVGDGDPGWLCGSGLVSAIAALRRVGHLRADGRMDASGPLASRFSELNGVMAFGFGPDGGAPHLLQTDIRAFQSAKAAVAAGLVAVAQATRVKPNALGRVCVAGAFGGTLDMVDLVELGVLPRDLEDVAEVVNDAAMLGAAMLAFDRSLEDRIATVVGDAQHVELASDPAFAESFIAHTALEPYRLGRGLFR